MSPLYSWLSWRRRSVREENVHNSPRLTCADDQRSADGTSLRNVASCGSVKVESRGCSAVQQSSTSRPLMHTSLLEMYTFYLSASTSKCRNLQVRSRLRVRVYMHMCICICVYAQLYMPFFFFLMVFTDSSPVDWFKWMTNWEYLKQQHDQFSRC